VFQPSVSHPAAGRAARVALWQKARGREAGEHGRPEVVLALHED